MRMVALKLWKVRKVRKVRKVLKQLTMCWSTHGEQLSFLKHSRCVRVVR